MNHFAGKGGLKLYWRCWKVPDPRGVLVFVHGMGEHSGRYQFPVDYFTQKGFSIYTFDLRGHGMSEGRRAFAEAFEDYLADLGAFLKLVKQKEPKHKIFLIGHSFGGQIVLNYGVDDGDGLAGILVSSPNIRLKLPLPFYKILLAQTLSAFFPTLALGNELDPRLVSHDPLVVRDYQTDPLVLRRITVRLAHVMMQDQAGLIKKARRFHIPCLLMHAGDDQICDPAGTRDFFEKIPLKDKKLKIYPGFYHELFNEVERKKVFQDMEVWIEKHL